jgi:hypothetical protein
VDPSGNESADYDRIGFSLQTKRPFVKLLLTMSDPLKPLFAGLDASIAQLARKAAAAASLTVKVQQFLPDTLRPHVVAAARRGDDLVVIVDSAAWSARVRYAGPKLKEQLAAAGETVAGKVRVKVGRGTEK